MSITRAHPPRRKNVSRNLVLPDEIIERVRQYAEATDVMQWGIGDILVEVVDEFDLHIRRSQILKELANKTGLDVSTLCDREIMARFYPEDVRDEYGALTYHQLRACKSAGDNWQHWADWALDNLPAPVAIIRLMIKHNGDLPPAWEGRLQRLIGLAEAIAGDEDAPEEVVAFAATILDTWRENELTKQTATEWERWFQGEPTPRHHGVAFGYPRRRSVQSM